MSLRISHPEKEGIYQGSKWLKYQVLCDAEELRHLFTSLNPFYLFHLTGIGDGAALPEERFLQEYASWIEALREGIAPKESALRQILATALIRDLDALWLQEVSGKGYLTKIAKPLIQIQAHYFTYSAVDEVFRPMSMGPGSIFWGLQFAFPQIYQDAKTMDIIETEKEELFEKLRFWVRDRTRATPFVIADKKINVPIRLGKNCFSWIAAHPELAQQGISVYGS